MGDWNTDFSAAPLDQFLEVIADGWNCPAYVRWYTAADPEDSFWEYQESILSDVVGAFWLDEQANPRWRVARPW